MVTMVTVICHTCGKEKQINKAEYNRRMRGKSKKFFCSRRCSVIYGNSLRDDLKTNIEKECPQCGKSFHTKTGCRSPTFCSRGCASAGSYLTSPIRIEKCITIATKNLIHNQHTTSLGLRKREMWKYERIKELLENKNIKHIFEYPLENAYHIFDLALMDYKIFIEFDGADHNYDPQIAVDNIKTEEAYKEGWTVIRVPVQRNTVIETKEIEELLLVLTTT